MLEKRVIFPFSSIDYMLIVNYIFLMNITYVFAIITCLGFLVLVFYIHVCKFKLQARLYTHYFIILNVTSLFAFYMH